MGRLGGYQLGIDLGTTYTSAAVCRSDERHWVEPEVVTLGTRGATVPSVLYLAPDGSVVVGEAAERRAVTDPDRVVREFKRRIGDSTPLVVAGRAWTPEDLSARLVRWVVDRVAEREGGPATRVAVTHPASWGPHKRDLLGAALAAQGVTVTFLAEPQAAALHYAAAERVEPGSTIAVYDLGGGAFDAAVVRKGEPGRGGPAFVLLGRPEGLERLGGIDFDEVVFDHVREALPDVFAGLDPADPEVLSAVGRVRRECTDAKEALSADTEVSIPVLLPAARGTVRLHRSEFESLIRPLVEETVSALRAAVASAKLTPEELTAVLLVGGSSRIPLVAQMVSEQLNRPVAVDADPKNAIAKGAALAVSPRPTASWPGIAVPPVSAHPAPVGPTVALATPAAAAVPPPPRPGRAPHTPSRGAPHAPGPVHEPATSLLSGREPEPPPYRPTAGTAEPEWYDDEPEPRRRTGLLVGAGGLLAVAGLVVGVLLLGGSGSDSSFDTSGSSSGGPTPQVPESSTTSPLTTVDPTDDPVTGAPGTRPGGGGGNTGGAPAGGGTPAGGPPTTDAPTVPPSATTPPADSDPPPSDPPSVPPEEPADPVPDAPVEGEGGGGAPPEGDTGTPPAAEGAEPAPAANEGTPPFAPARAV